MHIRHRFAAVLAALAISVTAAATGAAPAAAQSVITVEQGKMVSLVQPFVGSVSATVDPPTAGSVQVVPVDPLRYELRFTASTSYIGLATVIVDRAVPYSSIPVLVVGPRADVGATFTPRPAPGPCLVIQSGATVGFGDVTVGATTTAATETVLRNCSSGLDLDIYGSITEATSGTGPGAVVWEPVLTTPTPDQFGYRLQDSGDNLDRALDDETSVFIRTLPNSFTRPFDHVLTIGSGSTTGLNSAFSATIILVATTAAP